MIKSRIRVMLAINEMNQKQLAEKAGIREPSISALCKGTVKHIPVYALDSICKVLHCQPGDLFEYIPDEEA